MRHPAQWQFLAVAGFALLGVLASVSVILLAPSVLRRPRILIAGVGKGEALGIAKLSTATVRVTGKPISALRKARVTLDGSAITVALEGDALVWKPGLPLATGKPLAEGMHKLRVQAGSRILWRGPSSMTVRFSVDRTAPAIVAGKSQPVTSDQPVTFTGTVEPGSTVTVGGQAAKVVGGRYDATFATPPIGVLQAVATDAAGNQTEVPVRAQVMLPDLRAVHVTSIAWATAQLREPVLLMADQKRINAVQLDLKDEAGRVGHTSKVPLVNQIGASQNLYALTDAVNELHRRGLRVVGRIVVFRDPLLAEAEWKLGGAARDAVVQSPDGTPYKSTYGKVVFTNPANRNVRDYNLAIAHEAAMAGVDDILFDYIRRPEGSLDKLRFPNLEGPVEGAIIAFLNETSVALRGTKTRVGVSVFGIAAKNPEQIAQPIKAMAEAVDYIAPMVYPSHWGTGWYNVNDPNGQPYDIVLRSLQDFQRQVKGTGAKVIPWLQDFSLGRDYGADQVKAQVQAAHDVAINGYLIWDPKVTYHADGLPIAK